MFENEYKSPKPISLLLDRLIQINGWEDKVAIGKIARSWSEIVGETISAHTRLGKFINGELSIKTDSSIWRSELLLRQEDIIKKINSKIGKIVVTSLKIK